MRRILSFTVIAFLLTWGAGAVMYLTSGTDSYGQGLSYPGVDEPPSLVSFVVGDHTSRLGAVFLGATLYRPEFASLKSTNRSDYYWLEATDPHFSLFAPFLLTYYEWEPLPMSDQDFHVPAVQEFLQSDWKPAKPDYQIAAFRDFVGENPRSVELSRESYPGLDEFLKGGDQVPGRPLL